MRVGTNEADGEDFGIGASAAHGIVGRIYGNLGKLLGGKAIAGLISLGYMVIALRALGVRDYGVLILVHAYTITVGGIVEFPGWHAVVRYGAQAAKARDEGRLVRLLRFAASVELVAGALAVIATASLAPIFGPRLGWSHTAMMFAAPYSLAVLATIRATPAGYLQLTARFDLLGIHNLVSPTIRLIGALIAFALGAGLLGFLVVWLIAALAEWASMWIFGLMVAHQHLAGVRLLGSPRGAVAENAGIRAFMIAANADITFGELAPRIAPLAVGWVLGPVAAGIYAVAQRFTTIISHSAGNLGQASYAELARLIAAGGQRQQVWKALLKLVGIALAAALPLVVLIAVFGGPLALLVGGQQIGAAGGIILWLVAARTVLLVAPPASSALVAFGRPDLSVWGNLVSSLVMLPLLPLFLVEFGLTGAGVHAVLQAVVAAGLLGGLVWRESRHDRALRADDGSAE
jgi:O-antigen/teichoic acid export membrane protein